MGCFALAYTRTIATTRCASLVNKLRRYSNTAKSISRTKTLKPKSHLHKKIAHYVKKMISSIIDRSLLRNFSNSPSTRGATFSGRRASWKGWATWPPPWIIPSHPSTTFFNSGNGFDPFADPFQDFSSPYQLDGVDTKPKRSNPFHSGFLGFGSL